ncbi:MAG: hypothetical protein ACRDJP_02310 [Actinomycetota bacterium]
MATLDADSPEAHRANELARQLLTARVAVLRGGPGLNAAKSVYQQVLLDAVTEALEAPGTGSPAEIGDQPVERTSYLVSAMASAAGLAAYLAAGFAELAAELRELADSEPPDHKSDPEEWGRWLDRMVERVTQMMHVSPDSDRPPWPRI